jgi:hypothetical protein
MNDPVWDVERYRREKPRQLVDANGQRIWLTTWVNLETGEVSQAMPDDDGLDIDKHMAENKNIPPYLKRDDQGEVIVVTNHYPAPLRFIPD